MKGCIAPGEIPGISASEASVFGEIAENMICADFMMQNAAAARAIFQDHHNPAAYLYFLAKNNPQFTEQMQRDFYRRLYSAGLMRVPDLLIHSAEKAFYEIKPESASGMRKGIEKVGTLSGVYRYYRLPYIAGTMFRPRNHTVALAGTALRATLNVRRSAPGLIMYTLCLEVNGVMELATLAVILRHIIRELNRQRGNRQLIPVDLSPIFQKDEQLTEIARKLGLTMAAAAGGAAAVAGWKHFWKAVAVRFAVRGSTAAVLSAADGPLPVGELIAAGLALWTVVDIIRLSDELWQDADRIARTEI